MEFDASRLLSHQLFCFFSLLNMKLLVLAIVAGSAGAFIASSAGAFMPVPARFAPRPHSATALHGTDRTFGASDAKGGDDLVASKTALVMIEYQASILVPDARVPPI
jgi:hypothetical protein